jgi:hypothetical protein
MRIVKNVAQESKAAAEFQVKTHICCHRLLIMVKLEGSERSEQLERLFAVRDLAFATL